MHCVYISHAGTVVCTLIDGVTDGVVVAREAAKDNDQPGRFKEDTRLRLFNIIFHNYYMLCFISIPTTICCG
jgi:hypothetical protein